MTDATSTTEGQLAPFPEDWARALAVVAHPDDLEFGSAGAIAAWTAAGKEVVYLLASRGEAGIDGMAPEEARAVREAEQRDSAQIVGVKEVEFLDHRDGVIEYGLPLRRDIAAAIRRHRPDLVLTYNHRDLAWVNHRWNMPDHRNTGRAALDAVADAANRWVFPELLEQGLEPWSGVRHVAIASSAQPTHAVDLTATLDTAVASLEAHRVYLDGAGIGDVRGPITGFARQIGERFGGRPAASFELLNR
ncbi:PIG-L deacetylase family protein [Streptomyces sp. NPDC058000]|uniref:PIG-L deacetylase family protein n=1 Tax=Streptomyces sp. NPDC058000 TaxID=3346299 RepID=UPI0036EC18C4